MCGIFCEIHYSNNVDKSKGSEILVGIKNRGPDSFDTINIKLAEGVSITFSGAVLWMRGEQLIQQPLENEHGLLLYNGDIFDETWDMGVNDTKIISERLVNIEDKFSSEQIIKVLRSLKGPFSIIYYNKASRELYFTRDRIGRSSLLFHKNKDSIVISSVLDRTYKCIEVPATYIHILSIDEMNITLHQWNIEMHKEMYTIDKWFEIIQNQQSLPDEDFAADSCEDMEHEFVDHNAVEDDVIQYVKGIAEHTKCKDTLMKELLREPTIKKTVEKVTELLEKSVKMRLEAQPHNCKKCIFTKLECNHCTGILFSGGLDCTILAFLADKCLPKKQTIELLNVAFRKDDKSSYNVPDRLTGRQSYEELKKLCSSRHWLLREINVPKCELEQYQKAIIGDLVYPRQTILDESLGSALWFAARGRDDFGTSDCRVLLLGSGADELFGGYTRHRNAFKRHGWFGLKKELYFDWKRISFRNLARDNRVICDHGRQPRMPYLDDDFTEFVLQLPPWLKCFPIDTLKQGTGDKLLLRLVAYNLGLKEVVTFPKRALQFGSRIANKKENGKDLSKTFSCVKLKDNK